jgi:hypothetical protein
MGAFGGKALCLGGSLAAGGAGDDDSSAACVDQNGAEAVGPRGWSVVDQGAAEEFEEIPGRLSSPGAVVQGEMPEHGVL